MRSSACILASIAGIHCFFSLDPLFGQTSDPASDAANARQDAHKTVEVKFTVRDEIAPGGISDGLPKVPGMTTGRRIPAAAATIQSENRIIFSGSHLRYENNHSLFHGETGRLVEVRLINVCNGEYDKQLFTKNLNGSNVPQGVIGRNPRSMDIKSAVLLPLTLALRGADPSITPYLVSSLKATGKILPIGGRPCREYIFPSQRGRQTGFWLDPAQNYVARRIRTEEQGRLVEQFDVDYRPAEYGDIPSSWVRNRYSPEGKVRVSTRVVITSAMVNEPQPKELFDVTFPPGAKVFDGRVSKDYRVQEDGTMREISRFTGEELPSSVDQPGTSWLRRNRWLLIASGIVTAAALLIYIFFYRPYFRARTGIIGK